MMIESSVTKLKTKVLAKILVIIVEKVKMG